MFSQYGAAQQDQASSGPQATFTPNAGGYQSAGSYPPPRPAGSGFFDSLRSSGYYRSEPRVLGGVCAGIAARFGWDRTLVRVITVVLALFAPILCAAYGVAWAFLPEHRDGRIHFQSLLQGRFDIAHLGALLMVLIGVGNIGPWFTVFGVTGIGVMVGLSILAIAIIAIIGVTSVNTSPFGRSFPSQGATAFSPTGMENPMPTPPQSGTPSAQPGADWRSQGGPVSGASTPGASWEASSTQAFAAPPSPGQPFASHSSPMQAPPSQASFVGGPQTPHSGAPGSHSGPGTPGGPAAFQPYASPAPGATVPPQQPRPSGPAFSAPGPQPGHTPPPFGAGAQASPHRPPPAYMAPPMNWRPGPMLKPRVLPAWLNLATTGLIVLVIAATLFILHQMSYGPYHYNDYAQVLLIGGGSCLVIVGLVIAIASMRDRSAGWMVALSIIGTLMAIPTIMVGVAGVNYAENNESWSFPDSAPVAYYDWSAGSLDEVVNGELHLEDMPTDQRPTIEIQDVVGELILFVRKDQPVEIQIVDMFGTLSADYVEPGEQWVPTHLGLSQDTSFRSITDKTVPVPTVRIHNMLGSLRVIEVDMEEADFAPDAAENVDPVTPSTLNPQSALPAQTEQAQSADRPQSATTPASGQ